VKRDFAAIRTAALALAVITVLLAGCGGGGNNNGGGGTGGGGGTTQLPTAAANLTISGSIKVLTLQWTPGPGATEFHLLFDADGTGHFQQVGSSLPASASQATLTVAVHEVDWAKAQFAVDACNSAGCTRSTSAPAMPAMLGSIGYFKASSGGVEGDEFGYAVAVSADGKTLAVGAPSEASNATGLNGNEGDDSASESGAVYVFTNGGGTWSQQAYVKASNTDAQNQFGRSVALSGDGNTLAVGAFYESSSATGINGNEDQSQNPAGASGAAYIFARSGATWSQQAYVKASNTDAGDFFGASVDLSSDGNTLVVGAPGESSSATGVNGNQADNSASGAGAAYVFSRSGSAWSQQAYVKASNTGIDDQFGYSAALSGDGNSLAVGAWGESSSAVGINGNQTDNSRGFSGATYVFAHSSGTWSQQAYVKASNTVTNNHFGWSVSLSSDGNTLAVGAIWENGASTGVNSSDEQIQNQAKEAGAAYVFSRDGNTWSQQAYVKASNTDAADLFGASVDLSSDGNTLVVGAYGEDSKAAGINGDQSDNSASGAGAAYAFVRAGTVWSQEAYVKAANTGAEDVFGSSVAVSADGSTLAVGAHEEDGGQIGVSNGTHADVVNGQTDAGAVYLY